MKWFAGVAVFAVASFAPGLALAAPIGVSIADPSECLPGSVCGPDIQSATAIYDPSTGLVDVLVTFYAALPSQAGVTAPRDEVKFVLAHAVSGGHCGNITSGNILNAIGSGDVVVRGYAVATAESFWTSADLAVGGYAGVLEVPRVLGVGGVSLEYTVTNPALVGSSFTCFEVSTNAFVTGEPTEDATAFAWFPGMDPAVPTPPGAPVVPAPPVTFPITPPTPMIPNLPVNFAPPAVTGKFRVGSVLHCSKGLWDIPPQTPTYEWIRGSTQITAAWSSAYRVKKQDAGRRLRCGVVITYTDGRSTSKTSSAHTVATLVRRR